MKVSDIEIAYCAGVLEGEACFDIRESPARVRDPNNMHARIIVEMKDRDVLERLQRCFGGTLVDVKCPSKIKVQWSPYYKWLLSERESVFNCLIRINQFMSQRRKERINEMMTFLERKIVHEL